METKSITSAFQGITTPLADLYNEIHTRGWQVTKVDTKDGQYVATAKNPHGQQVEKTGRDPQTAVAALLSYVVRQEFIRQGAWTQHWAEQLEPIAQAYAKAPVFDHSAAGAWQELAHDCMARAQQLGQQLDIEVVDEPEPYSSPQEMWKDVQRNKHLSVSRANSDHPVWSEPQVIAYRIVHDVLGHAAAGGDFGWTGENLATAAHMPHLSPSAQAALFTESIGQAAYRNYYRGWGPQKITFLNDFLQPAQEEENDVGHGGEPVENTLSPGALPQRVGGVRRDPNYKYDTGIIPPALNAVSSYGDPLDHMGIKDVAHKLDTGWSRWKDHEGQPDLERMKTAITNAFRAALLSPKKSLRWNAAHYQDLAHIPHHVTDPKVYYDALETARIDHNRGRGVPHPEINHKAHYEALLDFYRYYQRHHPELSPSQSQEAADREVMVMQAEIEEKLLKEAKDPDLEIIEPKVFKTLDKRLKEIVKDTKYRTLYSAVDARNPYVKPDRYGAFISRHLIAVADLSRHTDYLLEAALEDVKNHDGAGHHFRQAALSLRIPYVGPKIISFAWLLLQPLTSQLATIDTHVCDLLGHKQKDVPLRDYFRLERELQAGRDAAGYSHMPLGQFQWSIWDHKRNGPGEHQDHSPLRVWEPQKHHTVDWKPVVRGPKADKYVPPEWWQITEPYRQQEAAKWNIDVAPYYPKKHVPWREDKIPVTAKANEFHLSLGVPQDVRDRIKRFVDSLDLPADAEVTPPEDYHITMAYAEDGHDDPELRKATERFNFNGTKFTGKELKKLGDEGALVIELESPDFKSHANEVNKWLEDHGADVTRYPGGFTPHITVAYVDEDPPPFKLPPLSFRAEAMTLSRPREHTSGASSLSHRKQGSTAVKPSYKFHSGPQTQVKRKPDPNCPQCHGKGQVEKWDWPGKWPCSCVQKRANVPTDYSQYADPNCKVCYGFGGLEGLEEDGRIYPCYKCVRGKVPPSSDLREHMPIPGPTRNERKDMAKIPTQDLRTASQSPVKVIKSQQPGAYADILGDRIPVLYRQNTERLRHLPGAETLEDADDVIYIGNRGQTHQGLERELGLLGGVAPLGAEVYPDAGHWYWQGYDTPMGFNYLPEGHDIVEQTLREHFPDVQYGRPDQNDIDDSLWTHAAAPAVMYHVAPQSARQSIMQHGIDHAKGERRWGYGYAPGNYLWTSLNDAARNADEDHDDIWEVSPGDTSHDPLASALEPNRVVTTAPISNPRLVPEDEWLALKYGENRTAALTRKQLLDMATQYEQAHGPDQSQVVHEFDDGWTVRALQTYGDMHREGTLMSNCFSPIASDVQHELWREHPATGGAMVDENATWHDYNWNNALTPEALKEPIGRTLYSLRDPDNLPHVSIDHGALDEGSTPTLGRHNSPPKEPYLHRVAEWAHANDDELLLSDIATWLQEDWDDVGGYPYPSGTYRAATWTQIDGPNDPLMESTSDPLPSYEWMTHHEHQWDEHGQCKICGKPYDSSDTRPPVGDIATDPLENPADPVKDLRRDSTWDEDEAYQWRSKNPLVHPDFRIDPDLGCFSHAEQMEKLHPEYEYVEGLVKGRDGIWNNEHAWVQAPDGTIVDPYFEWKFPGRKIEYRRHE